MTGVDASAFNIHAALRHAQHDFKVANNVQYKCITVEELADKELESFDCVVASEVIEHVTDKDTFISASTQLLKVILLIRHEGRFQPLNLFHIIILVLCVINFMQIYYLVCILYSDYLWFNQSALIES